MSLVALFCLAFVVMQIRNRLGTAPMYDMRLVDEKTARPAYRVRLRLFVFSTEAGTVPATPYSPIGSPPATLLPANKHQFIVERYLPELAGNSTAQQAAQAGAKRRARPSGGRLPAVSIPPLVATSRHNASLRRSYGACSRRAEGGCPYVAPVGQLICGGQHISSA